jgi:hypothetical protein
MVRVLEDARDAKFITGMRTRMGRPWMKDFAFRFTFSTYLATVEAGLWTKEEGWAGRKMPHPVMHEIHVRVGRIYRWLGKRMKHSRMVDKVCATCGNDDKEKLKKYCPCKLVHYCADGDCQKKNWAMHKLIVKH